MSEQTPSDKLIWLNINVYAFLLANQTLDLVFGHLSQNVSWKNTVMKYSTQLKYDG